MGSHPLVLYWAAWYDQPYPAEGVEVYPQFHPISGEEQLFKHLDQDRTKSLVLMPFSPELAELVNQKADREEVMAIPLPRYVVHLEEWERVICVRRVTIASKLQKATGQLLSATIHKRVYMLGWQTTDRGRNRKAIMFIHEDGTVELSSNAELR